MANAHHAPPECAQRPIRRYGLCIARDGCAGLCAGLLLRSGLGMVDLILPMKGVYFAQIARGEKTEEYRLRTDYWERRLLGRTYRNVVLTRGYPKDGGVEGVTRLTMPWRGWRYHTLQHDLFGPDPVRVFAIRVSPISANEESE
jgi:hypothetical protein